MKALEYKNLYSVESSSGLGLKILVSLDREITKEDESAAWDAAEKLLAAMKLETARRDPGTEIFRTNEKLEIEDVFNKADAGPIYMEAIPNEYFGALDVQQLRSPWYRVTTSFGHIKVGWRKRVLVIDWSASDCKVKAGEIFPSEDVTKGDHMIHAWSYAKATEYLRAIKARA